ncbi:MAG: DUF2182 domain-containing protein [Actinobacteria bacterium]|nr:DUF2182 domain-containing protein [Actinomycetota bacterium]
MLRVLPRPVWTAAWLLAGALLAWIITVDRMRGMDGGLRTDLGGAGWYLGIWVTMMGAMMLPSVFPMVLLFGRVSAEGARRVSRSCRRGCSSPHTSPSGRCTRLSHTASTAPSELSTWLPCLESGSPVCRRRRGRGRRLLRVDAAEIGLPVPLVAVRCTSFSEAGAQGGTGRCAWAPSMAPTASGAAGA